MDSTTVSVTVSLSTSNNVSICGTLYNHRDQAKILMPLFYSIVFVVGLLGNCLALHVIRPNMKKINSTTLYSLNLVISDILFTLSLPLRIIYYGMGFHWPLGEALCKISGLIFYINTYAGVNFMTCLSVDRFIAVVLPLRFGRLRKVSNVRYICVGVWLVVLAQTLPLLGMPMTNEEPNGHITCMEYPNFEKVDYIATVLIGAVFLGYIIPVVTILVCYSVLCSKLHLSAKTNHLTEKSGRSRKAIGVICCVSLVFVVCFSPYHIDILQYMIRKLASNPDCADLTAFQVSLHITVCLMNLNSCLDPFIYFFACKGYKRKLLKLLKMQVSMSFSSAVRTSHEGSSKDIIDGNKIQLNSCTIGTTSERLSERRNHRYEWTGNWGTKSCIRWERILCLSGPALIRTAPQTNCSEHWNWLTPAFMDSKQLLRISAIFDHRKNLAALVFTYFPINISELLWKREIIAAKDRQEETFFSSSMLVCCLCADGRTTQSRIRVDRLLIKSWKRHWWTSTSRHVKGYIAKKQYTHLKKRFKSNNFIFATGQWPHNILTRLLLWTLR